LTRTAARSDTGRVREGNEDRYLVREAGGIVLIAVADGVGGGPGGEIAADAAVNELATRFFSAPASQPVSERLGDAIREANTAVLRAAEAESKPSMASTLVAAAVRGFDVVIGNLGDSRAYVVRDGESRQLTVDHSGALAHGITRFVGDPRGVQADVFVERLVAGDRLVLCSDGLTRHVDPSEIAGALSPGAGTLDQAADRLVALANSRGGEDNVTLVLYAADGGQPGQRALGLGLVAALVVLVVGGALAVLASLAPDARPTEAPAATPIASASAAPSASPSAVPSPAASPSATP
jgi:protein phosphatase